MYHQENYHQISMPWEYMVAIPLANSWTSVDSPAWGYAVPEIISHTRENNIMIEITNQNFNKVYPHLEHTLKNASFIAIDGEFTGIEGNDAKNRLVILS